MRHPQQQRQPTCGDGGSGGGRGCVPAAYFDAALGATVVVVEMMVEVVVGVEVVDW